VTGAWIITSDFSGGPWPSQVGDSGPPGASQQAVIAAREHGQPFRVVDYSGQPRYEGKAWPDGRVLAAGFITEDGRPAVDPDVADLVEVLDSGRWVNVYDFADPHRAGD
jgi:hypothetical protein